MARRFLAIAGACAALACVTLITSEADAGWRRCCHRGRGYGYGYNGYNTVGYTSGYGACTVNGPAVNAAPPAGAAVPADTTTAPPPAPPAPANNPNPSDR